LNIALLVQVLLRLSHGAVVRVGHLQVSLNAAGGVLRAVTVETVWQEHNEAVLDIPLGLAADDKLIDHCLRTIREITELGLPQSKRVRQELGVAVLEA